MRVIDLLNSKDTNSFSFELLPPLKGTGIEKLYSDIDTLREFGPRYINITTHRSEYVYKETADGLFQRNRMKRRPGTVAVAASIKNKYDIKVIPHMLCSGFTREDTEYELIDLQFLGITDVFVLRGDKAPHEKKFNPEPGGNVHAIELEEQINDFNRGLFVDGSQSKTCPNAFSYGVACYPEKHDESPNAEQDLMWLKKKVDAGAQYAVTQMFYDNRKYFDFVERARKIGIDVPIVPGIKPISKLAHLSMLPKTFKIDLPEELVREALKCKDDMEMRTLGVEWCTQQCKELLAAGVPGLHFYTVGAVNSVKDVAKAIY